MSNIVRNPAGAKFDLTSPGGIGLDSIDVLATRPDRGDWLITMTLDTFTGMLWDSETMRTVNVEVKRRKKSALHTMFQKEVKNV